jgi:hypothetical protein
MSSQRTFISYASVLVLFLGVVSRGAGIIVHRHRRAHTQTIVPVPYTMVSNRTSFSKAGDKGVLDSTQTRYVRGDGSFKEVTTRYNQDGSVLGNGTMFGITGRGVFGVSDKSQKLVFLSAKDHAAHALNEEQFRNDPFSRDDVVLGYKVRVLRSSFADNAYIETYFAPALANAVVKSVDISADGASTVTEAVKIDLGEPSVSEFNLPNYPVDYGSYEHRINQTDNKGNHDMANEMRRIEQKSKSP